MNETKPKWRATPITIKHPELNLTLTLRPTKEYFTDEEIEEKKALLRELVRVLARDLAQRDHEKEMEYRRCFKNPITWEDFPDMDWDEDPNDSSENGSR